MEPPTPLEAGPDDSWRSAWALSRPLFTEFAFQAVYALRQGNLLTSRGVAPDARTAVATARQRMFGAKLVLSLVMLGLILAIAYVLRGGPSQIPDAISSFDFSIFILAGALVFVVAILWLTGIQVAPLLASSKSFVALETLPIPRRLLQRVAVVTVLRVLDLPALVALIALPLATAWATQSPLVGVLMVPATACAVIFAATLSLLSASFFQRHVAGLPGASLRTTTLRWAAVSIVVVPVLMIVAFLGFLVPELILTNSCLLTPPLNGGCPAAIPPVMDRLLAIFPFAWTYLAGWSADAGWSLPNGPYLQVAWIFATLYLTLAEGLVIWFRGAPLRLALATPRAEARRLPSDYRLHTSGTLMALLRKDLRIASRSPEYAILMLFPIVNAGVIALSTDFGNPTLWTVHILAFSAVVTAAGLTVLLGPAVFASEVMGYSLTQTFPLPRRMLLAAKATLMTSLYLIATILVLVVMLGRLVNWDLLVLFAGGEALAVLAATLVEVGILYWRAGKTGAAPVSQFMGALGWSMVIIPGALVAAVPPLIYELQDRGSQLRAIPLNAVFGLVLSAVLLLEVIGASVLSSSPILILPPRKDRLAQTPSE